jgi:hypothetical protein
VKLTADGRDRHRLVSGGTGFGCLPLEQHFGLGNLTKVDALDIWWPSGLKQRIERLSNPDGMASLVGTHRCRNDTVLLQ